MQNQNLTFIATVFNEESTIEVLLNSLLVQTTLPGHVIITDGGSTDNTVVLMNDFIKKNAQYIEKKNSHWQILVKPGNRSVGRNEAIKKSTTDTILVSDSGCELEKHWVENIIKPFQDPRIDVVAGYYDVKKTSTIFEKCLALYVLVQPDKVNPETFLPATRSCAMRKKVWQRLGGYPEQFSHNEDYVFAKKMKQQNMQIFFAENAIVHWIPKHTVRQAFTMFYRFAFGDAEAGIYRPKVAFQFIRYLIFILLLLLGIILNSIFLLTLCTMIFVLYIAWAAFKNYKYVNNLSALYILPFIQIIADVAVISGTFLGFLTHF
jgi:glycosyltransferase involved in cell wall biosynthesis